MNEHMKAQGIVDSLGKQMKSRPDVRGEGAYSLVRIVRVAVSELDGSEVCGKARLVMGRDGKPEKLEIRGGLLPLGDVLIAQSGSAAYLLTLEREGNDFKMKPRVSGDGMTLVCEFSLASAMQIKGKERLMEDPLSWGDVVGEMHLNELRTELDGVLSGKASALTKQEILSARFRFTDGSEIEGRVLFGEEASVQPGCIKSEWEKDKPKIVDALRVKGGEGRMGCFIIKGNLQCVTDISAAFTDVAKNPLAFSVEMGGHRYAGVMA